MHLFQSGHGVNPGHGYTKYVEVKGDGESSAIVFPSLIAPAGERVPGALRTIEPVHIGEQKWWVGEDALFTANPRSDLSQSRLDDPVFIPALVRKAWQKLTYDNAPRGYYVSGLPADWAADMEQCKRLAKCLRYAGVHKDDRIRIIAEPLGLIYSLLLDQHGGRTDDLINELFTKDIRLLLCEPLAQTVHERLEHLITKRPTPVLQPSYTPPPAAPPPLAPLDTSESYEVGFEF